MNIWDLNDRDLKLAARQLKIDRRAWSETLERMPLGELTPNVREAITGEKSKLSEVWRSRYFLVQVFSDQAPGIERLSINRTEVDTHNRRWRDGITWDELQELKRQCGRGHLEAVEIFPPDNDIVNIANIRHLWVFKSGVNPFGWRRG